MNQAFEQLADNPIIDELVFWRPQSKRTQRVRACSVLFRKPFIEVTMADGEVFQRHFSRASFSAAWAEASVILETLTNIELVSDFDFEPVADRAALVARVLACRDRCIAEAEPMFEQGMYAQYLLQFGEDYAHLPPEVERRLVKARQQLQ